MDTANSSELIIANNEISSSSEISTLSKESPASSEIGNTSKDASDTSEICFSNKETISGSELASQKKESSGSSEQKIRSISKGDLGSSAASVSEDKVSEPELGPTSEGAACSSGETEISNMMVLPSEILAAIFQYLDLDSRLHFR
jgi:hypothetical protein